MRPLLFLALAGACVKPPPERPARPAPNVLMVVVDDLRPFIGAYGAPAHTPNIDALVSRGVLFDRAYCQLTQCNPSRSSLLTGRRPESLQVEDNEAHFRSRAPRIVTFPQYFKQHGYRTVAVGKIFHPGLEDDPSWSEPVWASDKDAYFDPRVRQALRDKAESDDDEGPRGPSWEAPAVADTELKDGDTAEHALAALKRLAGGPFFLAVGFGRPHLPFVAPRKYYDLYPPEAVTLAPNPFLPKGAPRFAVTHMHELRIYSDIPADGPLPEAKQRELVRGYQACVSYIDAQVGRLLAELRALHLDDRTIVLLWGDHGYHLGEHGMFGKYTPFEVAARAPLIVAAPGQRARGAKIEGLVELVDVFPSVAELAGLPPPPDVEGVSFMPLLGDPGRTWKRAAFTEQPRDQWLGRSMRTDRYRYTEWQRRDAPTLVRELYDHVEDPDENVNRAEDPQLAPVVERLSAELRAGWRAARPVSAGPSSSASSAGAYPSTPP